MIELFREALPAIQPEWRRAWTPRPRPRRSAWCEQHILLPGQFAAQAGPFSFSGREYQREILDAVDDPELREIVIVAAPQVGKTELLRAIVLSQGEVDRAPMLFAGPDRVYIREQRTQMYAIADATPALAGKVPPERFRHDRWIDLGDALVYLAWSGSTQRLSGRSCKVVLCSEVDRWQHTIQLARKRTRAYWRSMLVAEGSPVGASPWMWDLYLGSDRRTFRVPCPRCHHHQELRFFAHRSGPFAGRGGVEGLRDDRGNWLAPAEARSAAYYRCERGCRIEAAAKNDMVARGLWVPEGCEVEVRSGRARVVGTPAHPGRRAGFHLNALYAPTVSFGDAAEEWLRSRDKEDAVQSFHNDWLGLPFLPRGTTPRWKELGTRQAGTYPRGTVPPAAYFLTAGADVQQNGVYWIVRAWGSDKTSWLVDFGFCARSTRGEEEEIETNISDLEQLDECLLHRRWHVAGENPRGLSQLAVRMLAIDRGYRPTDVIQFCRGRPGGRTIAVFGAPRIRPGALFQRINVDRNVRTGKIDPEGVECWGIDTAAYKTDMADRWMADRTRPGVWWLPQDILTTDGGEEYLRQVTSEARRVETKGGRKKIVWDLISGAGANHYLDCECYASAIADMVVGCDWDASHWEMPAAPPPSEPIRVRPDEPAEDFSAR